MASKVIDDSVPHLEDSGFPSTCTHLCEDSDPVDGYSMPAHSATNALTVDKAELLTAARDGHSQEKEHSRPEQETGNNEPLSLAKPQQSTDNGASSRYALDGADYRFPCTESVDKVQVRLLEMELSSCKKGRKESDDNEEAARRALRGQITSLKKENERLQSIILEYKLTVQRLKENENQKNLKHVGKEQVQLQEEVKQVLEKVKEKEKNNTRMEKKLLEKESEIARLQNQLEGALDDVRMQKNITSITTQFMCQAEADVASMAGSIKSLKDQLEDLRDDYERVEEEKYMWKEKFRDLKRRSLLADCQGSSDIGIRSK